MADCFKFCSADGYAQWEPINIIYFGIPDTEPVLSEPQSCINKKTIARKSMGLYRELCRRAYVDYNIKPYSGKD